MEGLDSLTIKRFYEWFSTEVKRHRIPQRELARKTNLSQSFVNKILLGKETPRDPERIKSLLDAASHIAGRDLTSVGLARLDSGHPCEESAWDEFQRVSRLLAEIDSLRPLSREIVREHLMKIQ